MSIRFCTRRGDMQPGRLWVTAVGAVLLSLAASPLAAKYSGGAGSPEDPWLISTSRDLLALAADPNDWFGCFRLTTDIDMADVPRDVACVIGTEDTPFRGSFDGAGRTIYHYTCITTGRNRVGLFGHIRGLTSEIRDLTLVEPYVQTDTGTSVGGMIGHLGTGKAIGCHVEGGYVRGFTAVGGLIGWTYATVRDCSARADVGGSSSIGGLVGICAAGADLRDCTADASVTGFNQIGGFVGIASLTAIDWCCARGDVTGRSNTGGLVGVSEGATVSDSYSTASVTAVDAVGGLVGHNDMSCHCSGGSLPALIYDSYSVGPVRGQIDVGGLVGINEPNCTVEESFWDVRTSGMTTSADGTGLTTEQLQARSTFKNTWWNFTARAGSGDYWVIRCEPEYPRFAWQIIDGDFDGDGDVDLGDFGNLALSWSGQSTPFRTGGADITGDGWLDALDLQALCRNWLTGAK